MRRRKNTRPTNIYWLVDTRTGVPFYCCKTVLAPDRRLLAHQYDAKNGTTRVNVKVRECGEHVRAHTVEVVPAGENWSARERFWIWILRGQHPDECCNTVDGGAGCPGRIVSDETRERLSAWHNGVKKQSAEVIARSAASRTGQKRTPEQRARMRASRLAYLAASREQAAQ